MIEFSNALGDVLRGAPSLQDVEDQVVELFWNTHQKINQSLSYTDTQDKSRMVSRIKELLFAPIEEVVPESMSIPAEEQGGSILVFILVVAIAAIAAVGGMALSMLIRKK